MNAAYVHLVLNHLPPFLGAAAMLALICGSIWRSDDIRRLGLLLIVFAALAGIPTFITGNGAQEIVKGMEGINREAIEPHQEAAMLTLMTTTLAAILAAFVLIKYRRPRPIARLGWGFAFALIAIATASAVFTSLLGGRIHHPETQMRRAR